MSLEVPPLRARAPVPGEIVTLAELEPRHILATLGRLEGNKLATAKEPGIGVNTLRRKLRRYEAPPAK